MINRINKNIRATYIILILLIINISCINIVNALGIAPAKKILSYESTEQLIEARIINNELKDMIIRITVDEESLNYVNVPESIIRVSKDEPEKIFNYTINFPEDIARGTKNINIKISEINEENNNETNSVSGLISVTQQLQVNIPYEGFYAEGFLSITTTKSNEIIASLNILNKGSINIDGISGELIILDENNNSVYKKDIIEKTIINPKNNVKIDEYTTIKKSGRYTAQYNINYYNSEYNKKIIVSKNFDIGEIILLVKNTEVKNFRLGTVAKFDIDTVLDWNTPIYNVVGEIIITDENNNTVGKTSIRKEVINSDDKEMSAYWDTTNVNSGTYYMSVILNSGNTQTIQKYKAEISENSIILEPINDESNKKDASITDNYIKKTIIIISIAILGIIILSIIIPKKEHKNKKPYK